MNHKTEKSSETNKNETVKVFFASWLSMQVNPNFKGHWLLFSMGFLNRSVPARFWWPVSTDSLLAGEVFEGPSRFLVNSSSEYWDKSKAAWHHYLSHRGRRYIKHVSFSTRKLMAFHFTAWKYGLLWRRPTNKGAWSNILLLRIFVPSGSYWGHIMCFDRKKYEDCGV